MPLESMCRVVPAGTTPPGLGPLQELEQHLVRGRGRICGYDLAKPWALPPALWALPLKPPGELPLPSSSGADSPARGCS